ncbi:NADPH-dependent FMN reductase [Hymenobacter negativus]|uniref:NAD(P)H-dependent oxidoreductase n=1 Tax=Hymenobacter negativus TaxID=2795026 RepID=A0ABS3QL21_9BACT|nr:NADPH-dependent FMN reductase [Hymenobacter negativus]MBO2011970.1 NAD(P)H-dependent oxidoreductase [Hymenobacter negativus]
MTILAFSGSPRAGSAVSHLLRAAAALAPSGTTVAFYEDILSLPHFSPDLDGPCDSAPAAVAALRAQMQSADAVLIATPEYAYGMPGSLKNALDWLVSAGSFYQKPTGVLSASPSEVGGERARSGLLLTLEALGAAVVPEASFPVPFVRTKLDGSGLVLDAAFAEKLEQALVALAATVPAT